MGGLTMTHQPPLESQEPGQESWLVIEGFEEDGFATKYNSSQQEPNLRLRVGDRIAAVVDGSLPQEKQRPFGGNSRLISEVIARGWTPLICIIRRLLGPPVRFKVGQQVKANCGNRGWLAGVVVQVWDEGSNGQKVPYVIRIGDSSEYVCAPKDSDDFIVKGAPRFKVGDDVMANQGSGYKKGCVSEVREERTRNTYSVKMAGDKSVWGVPEDLNRFVMRIARFEKGTKVLAKVASEYVPGTVEEVYHPNWVYTVRLDAGNVVFVPEDADFCVKL